MSNFHVLLPRRFHRPVYFLKRFWYKFSISLKSTNKSSKQKDQKKGIFDQRRLVIPFRYFDASNALIEGVYLPFSQGKSAVKYI